jgi:uncharacterized protein
MSDNGCKPEFTYPCPWAYKVIGRDPGRLREIVAETLSGCIYSAAPTRGSKNGAYHCLTVQMTVDSEADRIGLYERLRSHPEVIMVL